jgi:phage shock protein A
LKEYYGKYIERQEEELRQLKERIRSYELRLHEYEQEVDQLAARNKENEAFRGEHARRLKALADKL